jgi:hypothetical protein
MREFTAPYVFKEFPKYVRLADGSHLIVQDEDEEFAAVGNKEPEDTQASLLAKARELGLKPHHKMGVETLTKLIDQGH